MRIIAGEYRGRRLKTLGGLAVRPTSDKLRETLFNILRNDVPDSVFIDCYAGSGAVGLEALSRGARTVYLIEKDPAAVRVIDQNIAMLGDIPAIRLVRADVTAGLKKIEASRVNANICFLDPPYSALSEVLRTIEWLAAESNLMKAGGFIILEHARRDGTPEQFGAPPNAWHRARLLAQGSSALSFYRKALLS
jgi:16S rRNA (guanine(966)-N(2))-methyltransferase RsmD